MRKIVFFLPLYVYRQSHINIWIQCLFLLDWLQPKVIEPSLSFYLPVAGVGVEIDSYLSSQEY